jgi:hypothetical protein
MADRENFDRDREHNWDRDRQRWDRESSRWNEGRREEERWRGRSGFSGQGGQEHYQRGGSGREGGYGHEGSYGSTRDYSTRGGGTGLRENDYWSGRDRERDYRGDYFYGVGYGGGFASPGRETWGGGMGSYGERGRFAGRGPKGWRRSDERVREDINERLTAHPDIDPTEIDVQVRDGEVTLTGTVDDRHSKRMAEEIAEHVSGVKDVHNHIRVHRWEEGDRYREANRYREGDRNREGIGSGFQSSTGNNPQTPLGLNQPSQPSQQRMGQPSPQQNQYSNSGQYQGAGNRNR